jgi:hypothetical protein
MVRVLVGAGACAGRRGGAAVGRDHPALRAVALAAARGRCDMLDAMYPPLASGLAGRSSPLPFFPVGVVVVVFVGVGVGGGGDERRAPLLPLALPRPCKSTEKGPRQADGSLGLVGRVATQEAPPSGLAACWGAGQRACRCCQLALLPCACGLPHSTTLQPWAPNLPAPLPPPAPQAALPPWLAR